MTHITKLPSEILDYLGDFLNKRTLLNIVLVCQLFHQHFSRKLWRDVAVLSGNHTVEPDKLRAHVQWVHSLRFGQLNGRFSSDYYDITFPTLTALTFGCCSTINHGPSVEEQDANWARLVRLNPTIRDITLLPYEFGPGPTQVLEAVFTTLHRPRCLKLSDIGVSEFTYSTQQIFWRAVSRFEELDYLGFDQSRRGLHLQVDLSQMKRLAYSTVNEDDARGHDLKVLTECRGLTRLGWLSEFEVVPVDAFVACLQRSAWPLLDDLALNNVINPDEDFAAIIRHVPPLKHLSLESTTFGPVCFNQLRVRHFDTLRTVRMDACKDFSSRMALDVLLHCTHLQDFKARLISAVDVLTTPQPWVCHGLRLLEVSFGGYGDGLESCNWLVFEQLKRLTLLEEIDVRLRDEYGDVRYDSLSGMLQWRLGFGLEQLSTLGRLRCLRLDKRGQDAGREGVEWMLGHWPSLEKMYGALSPNWTLEKELTALIRKRGVIREI